MKSRAICHLLLLLALLFSACSWQQGLRMRQQLHDLQARNQADSLLTDDTLALSLVSWFDDHGTANERMLAHYLLARTYHDREEYPQALAAYHNAAACADTMHSDCDFHILCRVHAQMADLFRWQRLYERQIGELQMSYHYAMLDHDTAMILFAYSEQAFAYNVQNQIDSAIAIWKKSIALEREYGYDQYAVMDNGALVLPLFLKGKLEEARRCIDVYERSSGMFDAKGDIRKGSEIYYYTKAMYYLAVSAFDSTAYYLRKEHRDASDLNNRFAVAKGFFLLYERTHRLDSLSKYASLMCELQDSLNADKEKEDILKFDRLYKYDRLQHQISKKNQEIRRKKNTI